jgi:hypothetical protein
MICSTYGEKRKACRILMGKPEGKRPLERHRCRLEDNIKVDLGEIGWSGMDRRRALVNTVMNLRVPQNVGKLLRSCATGGFSRRAEIHGHIHISAFCRQRMCKFHMILRINNDLTFPPGWTLSLCSCVMRRRVVW